MRYLTVIMLYMLLASFTSLSVKGAYGGGSGDQHELSIVGKSETPEPFLFKMGETLQIKATGTIAKEIETACKKTSDFKMSLYFNGECVADLKSPQPADPDNKEWLLDFTLVRKSENEDNRTAWNKLFKKKPDISYRIENIKPTIAIGSSLPYYVHTSKLDFYVAPGWAIWLTIGIGLFILVFGYWCLVKKTKMLCDANTNYYSLGKSQMAFWGLLVVVAFAGVWILTGTLERIPNQVLYLIGISGATGLGAVVIGNKKQATDNQTPPAEVPGAMELKSKGFWYDICSDGNGTSFPRLQVVIWTILLGIVFVQTVAQEMSMPEFPETLVALLGVSGATYLGFKIPEKK
ncbi:MAG: hypothetical protein HW390_985 [Candidatus Brocadiaceae bacterium]|nr:hypothetical protein [Candidatus Brocadiaceae bacterium]